MPTPKLPDEKTASLPKDSMFESIWVTSRLASPGHDRLLGELARLLQSNPSPDKIERARRVLQAINESEIPFIAYSDSFYKTASLVFRNLLDHILDCCSFQDVIRIGHLSQSLRFHVRQYLNRNLTILLRKYVSDVESFRKLMKRTGSVISGSAALSFIDRGNWESNDLDLYVPMGISRDDFLMHLATEGYKIDTLYDGDDDELGYARVDSGIKRVCKLVRRSKEDPSVILSAIDLMESISKTSAIYPIFYYHSTIVMNWISHDSIVVLYPSFTFARRGVEHHIKGHQRWKDKYVRRGFQLKGKAVEFGIKCGSTCSVIQRSTDDAGALIIPLVDGPATPFEHVRWQTGARQFGPSACTNPLCPRSPRTELRRS